MYCCKAQPRIKLPRTRLYDFVLRDQSNHHHLRLPIMEDVDIHKHYAIDDHSCFPGYLRTSKYFRRHFIATPPSAYYFFLPYMFLDLLLCKSEVIDVKKDSS